MRATCKSGQAVGNHIEAGELRPRKPQRIGLPKGRAFSIVFVSSEATAVHDVSSAPETLPSKISNPEKSCNGELPARCLSRGQSPVKNKPTWYIGRARIMQNT